MTTATLPITVRKTKVSRIAEMNENDLKFGRQFSDHMFVADYFNGDWQDMRIVPFEDITLSPSISALHYGQAIFEGMRAYRGMNDSLILFRPKAHLLRFNRSAERMCMPTMPKELFIGALKKLIKVDKSWIPKKDGCSLYLRPFMFGVDEFVGVHPSATFKFIIFTSPTGHYYTEPLRVKVETEYSRACDGGVGFSKAAGNYAAAMYPTKLAQEQGFHQLIWTDAKEHKYIEESGTMNVMFVIGDILVTPSLSTKTILPGVTRDSILTIARHWGMKVEERRVSVDEVIEAVKTKKLFDAFGTGTAASIAHISVIQYKGIDYYLPPVEKREFSLKAKKLLFEIQRGRAVDTFKWLIKVR